MPISKRQTSLLCALVGLCGFLLAVVVNASPLVARGWFGVGGVFFLKGKTTKKNLAFSLLTLSRHVDGLDIRSVR